LFNPFRNIICVLHEINLHTCTFCVDCLRAVARFCGLTVVLRLLLALLVPLPADSSSRDGSTTATRGDNIVSIVAGRGGLSSRGLRGRSRSVSWLVERFWERRSAMWSLTSPSSSDSIFTEDG
jgi:hypothetical protein